jgi:Ca2+-binding EF-hand superfamily protein
MQRSGFFNSDADSDQQLSLEEFTKHGQGIVVSLKNEYLTRDANDDGKVSREEYFQHALGKPSEEGERKQAEQYDMDGDGFLSLAEFAITRQGRFAELFALLDKNGDGFLTLVEYAKPRPTGLANVGPIFFAIDVDADGRLSREEFLEQDKPAAERRSRPDAAAAGTDCPGVPVGRRRRGRPAERRRMAAG